MYYFLLGAVLGAVGIGLPTLRTLYIIDGQYIKVFFSSMVATASLYLFTHLVANGNTAFMCGNLIGSSLSVTWIAYREHLKKKRLKEAGLIA